MTSKLLNPPNTLLSLSLLYPLKFIIINFFFSSSILPIYSNNLSFPSSLMDLSLWFSHASLYITAPYKDFGTLAHTPLENLNFFCLCVCMTIVKYIHDYFLGRVDPSFYHILKGIHDLKIVKNHCFQGWCFQDTTSCLLFLLRLSSWGILSVSMTSIYTYISMIFKFLSPVFILLLSLDSYWLLSNRRLPLDSTCLNKTHLPNELVHIFL